jgi:osmotically-inducible protein OsmY
MKIFLMKLAVVSLPIIMSGCAAAVVGAGLGAAVAVGADSRGSTVVVDDKTLAYNVTDAVETAVPNGSFTIASYNQMILLAGQVPTPDDRDHAELATINTEGVKKVWNYLSLSVNETAGDLTQDAYITSLAKSRLLGQSGVHSNNVKVVTCSGVVYLLGDQNAGDTVQIDGAIKGIKQINGVKNVVNLIQRSAPTNKVNASSVLAKPAKSN